MGLTAREQATLDEYNRLREDRRLLTGQGLPEDVAELDKRLATLEIALGL